MRAETDIPEGQSGELSPDYLAAIVDSSDDAIIGKTLDGTIISWNRGAERIYGYTADEAVGKPIAILIPDDRRDELPGIFERLRRGERIDHYQTVRVRKDGKRLTISVTISPVRDGAGTIVGASAIARDITEQERAVHDALRTRDDFISIAAHELRTPLTTVYARLQLAERRIGHPGYEPDGLRQDLAIVRKGAEKLRSLVDRLMDVNAMKYSAADEPIEVDLADEPTELRVTVSDRGPGIPPSDRERIFEPFHRASQHTQGAGLGLHLAREIVVLHGGSLTVRERDGGGATFALTLPKRT